MALEGKRWPGEGRGPHVGRIDDANKLQTGFVACWAGQTMFLPIDTLHTFYPRQLHARSSHAAAISRPKEDYEYCDELRDLCCRPLNSPGDLSYH